MDPADPDSVHQALNTQGVLVGRHEQMLQGLVETLQNLSTTVNQIGHQVNLFTTQLPAAASSSTTAAVSNSPSTSAAPLSSPPGREAFVPPPEQYSGDLGLCGSFLLQCSHVFDLQPASYASDKAKIAYTMNLLRGRAAQWGTALWEAGSDALESHDTFVTEMRRVFDHPVQGSEAATRLFSLRQGSQSAANYSIDFRILAAETGWNEPVLVSFFKRGLSDRLVDELASRDEPDSLEELISLVIRLDNWLRERERERDRLPAAGLLAPPPANSLSPCPHPRVPQERASHAPPGPPELLLLRRSPCRWATAVPV